MAENKLIDIGELIRWRNDHQPIHQVTTLQEVVTVLWEISGALLELAEKQDARIKAMEDLADHK
jgi:hypothetical protein